MITKTGVMSKLYIKTCFVFRDLNSKNYRKSIPGYYQGPCSCRHTCIV